MTEGWRMTEMGVTCFHQKRWPTEEAKYHGIYIDEWYTEWNTIMSWKPKDLSHMSKTGCMLDYYTRPWPQDSRHASHWRSHLVVATSVVLFSVAPLAPGPWQTAKCIAALFQIFSMARSVGTREVRPGSFISFHSTACRVFNCSDVSPLPGDTRTKGFFWWWMIWKDKIITWTVGCHPANHIQQKLNSFRRC